ncbi:MAG: type II secretion system F family protein [Thermoanaerobaculia bacterium]|nr:type II secretion system F family protein [Thermoanaerobaculia bacterium]
MQFVCRLGTSEGRVVEEVRESSDRLTLVGDLERQGYHVFDVRPRGVPFRIQLPARRSRNRIPMRRFLIFNQELAALLRAGLPLLQALDLLLERESHQRLRRVLVEVRDEVKGGADLSDAFARFEGGLPPLYPAILRAGERSGELESVIRRFIRYQKLLLEARRKVVSALVYPSVLVALSLGMIAIMGLFVIPRFEDFYLALGVEMPVLTRWVLTSSVFVRDNVLWLMAGVALIGWALTRWARSAVGALRVDRAKVRLPLLGPVLHRFALSEFCRSLATLLSGGIPIVPSLEVAIGAVGNRWVRGRLVPISGIVSEGGSFHEALEGSGVATDIVVDMVKVGESTGALDDMLAEVSDFLDEEVETRQERILALLEPALLVVMGLVIATLLAAMYLPMFTAWEQVR